MQEIHTAVDVPHVRPSDFAACAVAIASAPGTSASFSGLVERIADEKAWDADYARAIALRYLALGRYLQSTPRPSGLPELLLVLAAAATPVSADHGFDPRLLESVARQCGARLGAANARAT
ncbi:MAG: hypothetical protein MUF07_02265 [Steroidobacteraceae bacterium]|jgi:hypothetical protein|nr:hypothetical protein [Steroidobacteraceae bacterium]